ncbi:MAG TPA: hypothetical protein VE715_13260 [Blastocatellia bacterium]|nr:hypothetical protein [Blastocatellia bacterium]
MILGRRRAIFCFHPTPSFSSSHNNKGDSRVTIPVVGMVTILGRLFTTPKQTGSQSDIVITVTPHIIRPAEIKPEDHLARFSGTQSSGLSESNEDVVFRAQAEEEQEWRLISRQPSTLLTTSVVDESVNTPNATGEKAVHTAPHAEVIPANRSAEIKPTIKNRQ